MQLHPLINKNSKHYDQEGETAIEKFEAKATIREAIGACKFNLTKYNYRKYHKGQAAEDEIKIMTYYNYKVELLALLQTGLTDDSIVKHAWKDVGIQWAYR